MTLTIPIMDRDGILISDYIELHITKQRIFFYLQVKAFIINTITLNTSNTQTLQLYNYMLGTQANSRPVFCTLLVSGSAISWFSTSVSILNRK